jgi:hypothetical protein
MVAPRSGLFHRAALPQLLDQIGSDAESGTREELRVLKIGATSTDLLSRALDAVGAWAASQGVRRIAVRCQTAYLDAYQALIKCGFRVRWSDLRMTLAGYGEPHPREGILWSNWEI